MLLCIVLPCITLCCLSCEFHTAIGCINFWRLVLFCSVMCCPVVLCYMLCCRVVLYAVLSCCTLFCNVPWAYSPSPCKILRCSVLFCVVLFCTVVFPEPCSPSPCDSFITCRLDVDLCCPILKYAVLKYTVLFCYIICFGVQMYDCRHKPASKRQVISIHSI